MVTCVFELLLCTTSNLHVMTMYHDHEPLAHAFIGPRYWIQVYRISLLLVL